jgi:hypothetical protein
MTHPVFFECSNDTRKEKSDTELDCHLISLFPHLTILHTYPYDIFKPVLNKIIIIIIIQGLGQRPVPVQNFNF